jgi:hypothetical protein
MKNSEYIKKWNSSSVKDMSYMFNSSESYLIEINIEQDILEKINNYNNIFYKRIKKNFDTKMANLVKIYLNDKSHKNRENIIKYINEKNNFI